MASKPAPMPPRYHGFCRICWAERFTDETHPGCKRPGCKGDMRWATNRAWTLRQQAIARGEARRAVKATA